MNTERALSLFPHAQYARLLKSRGELNFTEAWGYEHLRNVASDNHMVCDWSNATGMELPACVRATCSGHREDDKLPAAMPTGGRGDGPLTNREFYELIAPGSVDLPYVYDSLAHWGGCEGGRLLDGNGGGA